MARVATPQEFQEELAKRLLAPMGTLQSVDVRIDNDRDGWNLVVDRRYPGSDQWERRVRYFSAKSWLAVRRDERRLSDFLWSLADGVDAAFDIKPRP